MAVQTMHYVTPEAHQKDLYKAVPAVVINATFGQSGEHLTVSSNPLLDQRIPSPTPPPPPILNRSPKINPTQEVEEEVGSPEEELQLTSLNYENVIDKKKDYYEEVNFSRAAAAADATAPEGRDDASDAKPTGHDGGGTKDDDENDEDGYEEVVVDSNKYSYNNPHHADPNYENTRRSSVRSRSSVCSTGSAGGNNYDSVFGMARRFPSIRVNPTAKKERKKMSRKERQIQESFPRSDGDAIPMTFGGSLERISVGGNGSKPSSAGSKKSNTIAPMLPLEDSPQLVSEAGSSVHAARAVYSASKSPVNSSATSRLSLASMKRAFTSKINSSLQSVRQTSVVAPNSTMSPQTSQNGGGVGVERGRRAVGCCDCLRLQKVDPMAKWKVRGSAYKEGGQAESGGVESSSSRKRCFMSTSVLCGVIALSVIVLIIAGAVVVHHLSKAISFLGK